MMTKKITYSASELLAFRDAYITKIKKISQRPAFWK